MNIKRLPVIFLKNMIRRFKRRRERNRWRTKGAKLYKIALTRHQPIPVDVAAYKKKWRKLTKNVDTRWFKTYSYVSGKEEINFVEEDIFYMIIEPALNRHEFFRAYRDKNFYDRYNARQVDAFPVVLLRNMEGVFCDRDYRRLADPGALMNSWQYKKIVVKPSLDTGGGRNVQFFTRQNGTYVNKKKETLSPEYLRERYKSNFIIQDYIEQHDYFKSFNPSSLNTMRITTYRSVKDEQVHVLHVNLRMGGRDSQVDNISAGGAAVHVKRDGGLNDYATDLHGLRLDAPPAAPHLKFADIGPIPNFDTVIKTIAGIAADYYYFRILGFDVCLDTAGRVRIIEINFGGLATVFQWDSGSLFGEFTDEVIEFCAGKNQNPEG